jgi:hypothetical protein
LLNYCLPFRACCPIILCDSCAFLVCFTGVVVSEMIFLAFYVRAVFVRCKHAQIK